MVTDSFTAEAINAEELRHQKEYSSSKNQNVDGTQEDILHDVYENATEVCYILLSSYSGLLVKSNCLGIMSKSTCVC